MTKENLDLKDYYASSDLGISTTISLFYPIAVIDRTNPHKANFIFKRDEGLDKLIEAYWKNELKVDPLAYFNQLRVIKSRLYEERQ